MPTLKRYNLTTSEWDYVCTPYDIEVLPEQTGHSNQYLKTNGSVATWADVLADQSNNLLISSSNNKLYVTGVASNVNETYKPVYFNSNITIENNVLLGAAWNDYAEYRETNATEAGRCVVENGDDTMSLSTIRMQPAAAIVSDTYGMVIGKTDKANTPIAISGRVLAYTFEYRSEFHPGDFVCSGPNGTVSKMSQEEYLNHPECIIGIVSAIPPYEEWGENKVKVNNRIWIKV